MSDLTIPSGLAPGRPHAGDRRRTAGSGTRDRAIDTPGAVAGLVERTMLEGCRRATQRLGGAGLVSLGVTSALRGEGRTSIAAALARVQWEDHRRSVILVDLDLESPSLPAHLGLPAGPGISELAEGRETLETCLQQVSGDLWLLPAGRSHDGASRVFSRIAQSGIMARLAGHAEVVICDLPPLLGPVTGLEAAGLCAGVALVLRAGVTPMPRVREAAALLPSPPPVILNGTRSAIPRWLRRAIGDWT